MQDYVSGTANAASNLAGTPYTPYPGPQLATPSPQTSASWNLAGSNVGAWQPAVGQGAALTNAAATPISQDQINSYFDPYASAVTGAIQNLGNQNLTQNILPGLNNSFTSAGQFGSPQNQEGVSQAVKGTQQAELNAEAQPLMQGYQGAIQTALAEQQAQQTGGAQLGQLGALTSTLGAQDVGTLAASGNAQDTLAQANINSAISNFQNQVQWPYQNVQYASNIIRGLPTTSTPTTTQTVGTAYPSAYQPSPLATFASTAGGLSALGVRKGGHIQRGMLERYARGGGALSRYARAA